MSSVRLSSGDQSRIRTGRTACADLSRNRCYTRRLVSFRVGDTEEATAEALRQAALALVDDPEVARALDGVRAEMEKEGGTRRAADLIEAELPQG